MEVIHTFFLLALHWLHPFRDLVCIFLVPDTILTLRFQPILEIYEHQIWKEEDFGVLKGS
jgi:hypothetical protein